MRDANCITYCEQECTLLVLLPRRDDNAAGRHGENLRLVIVKGVRAGEAARLRFRRDLSSRGAEITVRTRQEQAIWGTKHKLTTRDDNEELEVMGYKIRQRQKLRRLGRD